MAVFAFAAVFGASGCWNKGQVVKGKEFKKTIEEQSDEKKYIMVKGLGAADPALANVPQKQALCQQAAHVDAQRKLAEILKGFAIEGSITVSQAMEKDSNLVSRVNAELAGAEVTLTEFTEDNNGCAVHMRIPKSRIKNMLGVKFE